MKQAGCARQVLPGTVRLEREACPWGMPLGGAWSPNHGSAQTAWWPEARLRAVRGCGGVRCRRVQGGFALEVVLEKDGREVGRAITDTFGEFVIDRLEPNSSGYHLKAAGPAGRCSTQFDLAGESRYLGVMALAAG